MVADQQLSQFRLHAWSLACIETKLEVYWVVWVGTGRLRLYRHYTLRLRWPNIDGKYSLHVVVYFRVLLLSALHWSLDHHVLVPRGTPHFLVHCFIDCLFYCALQSWWRDIRQRLCHLHDALAGLRAHILRARKGASQAFCLKQSHQTVGATAFGHARLRSRQGARVYQWSR